MIRLSANLTMLFQDLPFLQRIDAAAEAGFEAIECVAPYVEPKEIIAERLARTGMRVALFNMPAGDWIAGERGFAANPARKQEFRTSVDVALDYALETDTPTLHLMAGKIPADADRRTWRTALLENIAYAADALGTHGISIALEPINSKVDMPGYFYSLTSEVMDVIAILDRPNVKLLFDAYHVQIMEGDLIRSFERLLPHIGHVQIADTPGRHEPGTGEINYTNVLKRLDASAYSGWIGCEYVPAAGTLEGLTWASDYLSKR